MQIQVNTGHNIEGREALAAQISGAVESALSRFSDHITRVEIHLSDENSDKRVGHDAMRCMMEARLKGRRPIAVTHHAATINEVIDGAADKLTSLIEHTLGRQRHQRVTGQTLTHLHLNRNSRMSLEQHHGEPAANRFQAMTGTVLDSLTGLTWGRNANPADFPLVYRGIKHGSFMVWPVSGLFTDHPFMENRFIAISYTGGKIRVCFESGTG